MKAIMKIVLASVVVALFAFVSGSGNAVAQQYGQTLKQQLVGTWTLVSAYVTMPDGSKVEQFPAGNSRGIFITTANGRFAWFLTRIDVPKYASNDRLKGTPEEYKATVLGNVAYFGTYSVNADGTLGFHIEGSTFPNSVGVDQKRQVNVKGDEMDIVNTATTSPGTAHVIWKRVP